jgi:surface antigen
MPNATKIAPFTLVLIASAWAAVALADPPPHAPAHGWRKQNDPYYVGYTGKYWDRDYGILDGRCNRKAVATVLGGVIGGAIGSRVGDDDNRAVAILVGAAAGALIGNKIGRELDAADRSCIGHALEVGKPGQVVTWVNEETGVEYQMALGSSRDQKDDTCRRYMLLGIAGNKKSFRQGTACQTDPGVWNVVETVKT